MVATLMDHQLSRMLRWTGLLVIGLLLPATGRAYIPLDENGNWDLYGRFRVKLEYDDYQNPLVENRTRMRIGSFAGVRFSPNEQWEFNTRVRVGDPRNARIVDVTIFRFDESPYGRRGAFADEYFAKYLGANELEVTAGRAILPFWSNTQNIWDSDLTPMGLSFSKQLNEGSHPLTLTAGTFLMPDGMEYFHGRMHAAELKWLQTGQRWNWQWALSVYKRPGEAGGRYFLIGEDERDYLIGKLSFRLSGRWMDRLAYIGVDLFENFEHYSADDPDFWSRTFRNETTGGALLLSLGENIQRGDWRFQYSYAQIEWLAAMSTYLTTGLSGISRTNVETHSFRADYSVTEQWKVTGRIVPGQALIGSSKSTRFRIDITKTF